MANQPESSRCELEGREHRGHIKKMEWPLEGRIKGFLPHQNTIAYPKTLEENGMNLTTYSRPTSRHDVAAVVSVADDVDPGFED